ncbi:MAG TPA: hypothetical protein PLB35_07340 [Myxococcota bacterium]|nr:hypothetical protein [Myxococcota bacterium]HOH77055.1 hypothetical protein [Myxococcota bacterium]
MKRTSGIAALFLIVAMASGCGGDGNGNPDLLPSATPAGTVVPGRQAVSTIGAAGGNLASVDGRLLVKIPAGALAADTTITIDEISNQAHGGLGNAFRIGPDGTEFAVPASLVFTPDNWDLEYATIGGLMVAFQNGDMYWELAGTPDIDAESGTVTVTTGHLSDWSLVQGAVLMPMAAGVKTGKSLSLSVNYCYPARDDGSDLAPLGYECTDELVPLANATDWAVNGVPGGNATVGTISGSGMSATFTAPASKPSPDTVAVSVRLGGNTLLISKITIQEDAGDLNGTVDFTFTYLLAPGVTFKARADLALTMHDDGIDETNYDAVGSLEMMEPEEFIFSDMTCVLQDAKKSVNDEYFFKVLKDPLSVRWGYNEQWMYHCTGQTEYDLAVILHFFTAQGTACSQIDDVGISDEKAPQGEYTTSCAGTGEVTAEWDFR